MTEGRRVLITGIAGQLAGLVARSLEQRDDVREIIGIDVREPQHDLRRTEFVRADIRNPIVGRVLEAASIDTVVHLGTASNAGEDGSRARMKERNVIGAMQLLAACQHTPTLRRFVLRSSTAIYGSGHTDPASFHEEQASQRVVRHGYGKDVTEIEGYVQSLSRRRNDVDVTLLRFANVLGGQVDSAFHTLLTLPVVPTVLGFDPRLQFCHEDDAVAVLERAATSAPAGIYNVAGEGILYLSQCVRLAGRVPLPVPQPFVAGIAGLMRRRGRGDLSPDQLRFLQFGRVVDTTALLDRFGYRPVYSTRAAFEDFLQRRRIEGPVGREHVDRFEQELHGFLQRRGHERFPDREREVKG